MELNFCQSCGMPLRKEEELGTERDGSRCSEYCCYCYREGAFTVDCTMVEMIQHCAQFADEFHAGGGVRYTREEAVAEMRRYFPALKRWRTQH